MQSGSSNIASGTPRNSGSDGQPATILSPEACRDFERLFLDWMRRDWNQESLEAGGTGDLSTLATLCAAWATTVAARDLSSSQDRHAFDTPHARSTGERRGGRPLAAGCPLL